MIKNCPAFGGIRVERTGISLCRDGTKNVPANSMRDMVMFLGNSSVVKI